jgi:putative FmdB family regulatory protein
MPIYELGCESGHRVEVLLAMDEEIPACEECGSEMTRLPSRFAVGGRANPPPRPEAMPQTWKGTYEGNREYVTSLRKTVEKRQEIEERYPELAGDRRPILAHEGRYEAAPLRAGDPILPASEGHSHPHAHHHSTGGAGSGSAESKDTVESG